jgi:tetrahydromethanopterin S-methyltransferase subunit A
MRGDFTVVDAAASTIVLAAGGRTLAKELTASAPSGLCMVVRLHSAEDAAHLLRASTANLAVQNVICAGDDEPERPLAAAVLKLGRGDEIPSGPIGSLMNAIASQLEPKDLAALRKRIDFIDMLGCSDVRKVAAQIQGAQSQSRQANAGFVTRATESGVDRLIVPTDVRNDLRPDKTGHFRIRVEERSIVAEHFDNKDQLLRVVEGKTARDICLTLIRNGWVSKLEHAAYLGRELARAELALRRDQPFTQDMAEPREDDPRPVAER